MADRMVLITLPGDYINFAMWLGEGNLERGVRKVFFFTTGKIFNYPTPEGLTDPSERYDPQVDYVAKYNEWEQSIDIDKYEKGAQDDRD